MCNKGTCFVLMPMSDEYTRLLNAIEMAIREVRLRPIGPFKQDNLGYAYYIMKDVRENIINAEFIIAVVTGANPNVMLELGMSIAAKKKLIILIDQNEDIPFDLKDVSLLNYNPNDLASMVVNLKERLKNLKNNPKKCDLFPELNLMESKDWSNYQYLKEKMEQIKVEVKPMNCSIFLNNRYIDDPGSGIYINPKAERNILSISATEHFEHYEVLTENKLKENHFSIKMSPIDEKEYPERVISWLMKRKNDPDNPVLSRAITEYFWSQNMLDEAKEEAYFCLGKSPEWYVAYNMVGMVEEKYGIANYGKARYYYQIARDLNPRDWIGPYNIACIESKSGHYKEALKILREILKDPIHCSNYREIFNPGHYNKEHLLLRDPAFYEMRGHKEFEQILQQYNSIIKGTSIFDNSDDP